MSTITNKITSLLAEGFKGKESKFKTYKAWRTAIIKLDKKANFTGDEDIDQAFSKGKYDAEWDGSYGTLTLYEDEELDEGEELDEDGIKVLRGLIKKSNIKTLSNMLELLAISIKSKDKKVYTTTIKKIG